MDPISCLDSNTKQFGSQIALPTTHSPQHTTIWFANSSSKNTLATTQEEFGSNILLGKQHKTIRFPNSSSNNSFTTTHNNLVCKFLFQEHISHDTGGIWFPNSSFKNSFVIFESNIFEIPHNFLSFAEPITDLQ
jgi:hypothetical protein